MKAIEKYIYSQVAQKRLDKESAKEMLLEVEEESPKKNKDIAIIGLACRLPCADNAEEFWNNLKNGRNCLSNFPPERMKEWIDIYTNKVLYQFLFGLDKPEKMEDLIDNVTIGGFLKDISQFDTSFFGIAPKEAKFMSPEQKLMLKVAWESIEDAGYGGDKIYGTNTGVFIGKENSNLGLYKYLTEPDVMHVTGSWNGIIASRISYLYNLKGPSMIVDCACSSGLVSLHMASKSIRNGECEMAIVGGIQLQYIVEVADYDMSLSMVQSNTGKVRTFDKNANGTVWSEGIVSLVVKNLDAALRDGDNIHAVVKGSAINNDGASNGITAPDAKAQETVICNAWKDSGVNPETISYFEAHGTGTVLGDPIEIKGLSNAFRKYTDKKQFCAIGSTKPNIGHTVATSGLAGVVKIIYAMKNRMIPPILNFAETNPYIDFTESPVYLNDTLKEWKPDAGVLRACINSFGFSGTNCHVVLEEPPKRESEETSSEDKVIFLSAKSKTSITKLCNQYIKFLNKTTATAEEISYTANTGRGQYNYRAAVIFKDKEELKEGIKAVYSSLQSEQEIKKENVFYGCHIITNSEIMLGENEITESQKQDLTNKLFDLVKEQERDLGEICKLFVQGADVDMDIFYGDRKWKKVSVPVYVYDDKRCLADKKVFELPKAEPEIYRNIEHPLFDRIVTDSINTTIYETDFSVERHWILKEHVFMGTSVIPGTSYIEMAREVCQRYFQTENVELQNLIFFLPVSVREGESVTVQTVLQKEKEEALITICSKDKSGNWVTHAQGKGVKGTAAEKTYDLAQLKDRLNVPLYKKQDGVYFKTDKRSIENVSSEYFQFGDRWKNIVSVYGDERYIAEVVVKQELPEKFAEDEEQFYLHPALIDNAINNEISVLQGAYLPFVYKSIKIHQRVGKTLYSHIIRKNYDVKNPETANYDVVLFDENGNIIAEIDSYSIKKMSLNDQGKFLSKNSNHLPYYRKVWKLEEKSNEAQETYSFAGEEILLLEGENEKGRMLNELLRKQGASLIVVKEGERFRKVSDNEYVAGTTMEDYLSLLDELKKNNKIARIVHCLGCDDMSEECSEEDKLDKGVYSIFNLTKALLQKKLSGELSIHVLCSNANKVDGSETHIYAENNALIRMTRAVGEEYANYRVTCTDIDDKTDCSNVLNEFHKATGCIAAYRDNQRYIEELEAYPEDEINYNGIEIKENGTYVIAGGAGALGLEVSKYLASLAAVNLILINRTKLPERKYWNDLLLDNTDKKLVEKLQKIKDIEAMGSNVYSYGADISEEAELSSVISAVKDKFGTVDGILQVAGVAGNGFIMNKSRMVFDNVVRPKICGTALLDKLTKEMKPDFMVCFSSISTYLPSAGQSDYSAANAFLDSFADSRNLEGRYTKVINWPVWKEIGMAVDNNFSMEESIFENVETKRAMETFQDIMKSDMQKVLPAEINFGVAAHNLDLLPVMFSDELKNNAKKQKENAKVTKKSEKEENLAAIELRGRANSYSEIERKVAAVWGKVLELKEINIFDNFNSLGGDSILASQVYGNMQKAFPGVTDITDVFTYSTVASFAEYVAGKVKSKNSASEEKPKEAEKNPLDERIKLDEVLSHFKGLSKIIK